MLACVLRANQEPQGRWHPANWSRPQFATRKAPGNENAYPFFRTLEIILPISSSATCNDFEDS